MDEHGGLSHVSAGGAARMVDVSAKPITRRFAAAEAWVQLDAAVAEQLRTVGGVAKGNVLETARLAGVLGAKQTPLLIPMCHTLPIDDVQVEAELAGERVRIVAAVRCEGKTGVEMEAMTAAAVAALTVYDMVKSAGRAAEIGPIRLLEKRGGKSGTWKREANHGQD